MAKTSAFTLRLPRDLYIKVNEVAIASNRTQNAVCIELIELGLGKKLDVRQALQEMIDSAFPDLTIGVVA